MNVLSHRLTGLLLTRLGVFLWVGLALPSPSAWAEAPSQGASVPVVSPDMPEQDYEELFTLLKPLNLYRVDEVSKDLFKDFFDQKNKIYQLPSPQKANGNIPLLNGTPEPKLPPARLPRRTF